MEKELMSDKPKSARDAYFTLNPGGDYPLAPGPKEPVVMSGTAGITPLPEPEKERRLKAMRRLEAVEERMEDFNDRLLSLERTVDDLKKGPERRGLVAT